MKLFKKIIINFIISILFLLSILTFLIVNKSSLHFILKCSIQHLLPEIHVKKFEGSWNSLNIRGIQYKKNGLVLSIENCLLIIKPIDLLHFNICFKQININNVHVIIDNTYQPTIFSKRSKFKYFNIYLPIEILKVNIDNIDMLMDTIKISLSHLHTKCSIKSHLLNIQSVNLDKLLISTPIIKSEIQPFPILKINNILHNMDIYKNIFINIPLDIELKNISIKTFNINNIIIQSLFIEAKINHNSLKINTLNYLSSLGIINIKGVISLFDNYPIHIIIKSFLNFSKFKNQQIVLEISGHILNNMKLTFNINNIINFKTYIIIYHKKYGNSLSFIIKTPKLNLLSNNSYFYEFSDINFIFNSKLNNYMFVLSAKLNNKILFPINFYLQGHGNLKQLKIDQMKIHNIKGIINFKALVQWDKIITLHSKLSTSNFNLFKIYKHYPIKLNGDMIINGSYLNKEKWFLKILKINLQGQTGKLPIISYGNLIIDNNKFCFSNFKFLLGKNFIYIKGIFGKKINLNIKINAHNVNNFLPNFQGEMIGDVKLLGSNFAPIILMQISIRNFLWNGFHMNLLKLTSFTNNKKSHINKIYLYVENFKKDFIKINQLIMNIDGNFLHHKIMFNVKGKPISSNFLLNGKLNTTSQNWGGTIKNMNIDSILGKWKLMKIINVFFSKKQKIFNITPHYWQHNLSKICVNSPITLGLLNNVNISFNNFDSMIIKPIFKNINFQQNFLNGKIYFYWNILKNIMNISLNSRIIRELNHLSQLNDNINLNLELIKNKLYFNWLLYIKNKGKSNGKIYIDDIKKHNYQIKGNLNIHNISLDILNFLFSKNFEIKGIVNSKLKLYGTLCSPKILGNFSINNVNYTVLPFDLISSKLNIIFYGSYANIDFLAKTIQGNINLQGNAAWKNIHQWYLYIHENSFLKKIILSPNLKISFISSLAFKAIPNNYQLYGKIDVPWARIILQNFFKDTIESSLDEIIIDKKLKPTIINTSNVVIKKNILFNFRNNVKLSTFGLNLKLNGRVKLLQNQNNSSVNGKINVSSGRFHAYGQDLIVRKGNINFIGSINNPYINLEAIRNVELTEDSVIAGLRINGFVENPKINVFTEPTMSKQLAMSYLLHGKCILDNSNDSKLITSAILGLGIYHGEHIINKISKKFNLIYKISKKFGINNFSLDTINIGGNQHLQISSYISQNLQIKYGFNLFHSFTIFTVRYRLLPKLYLEIVSGMNKTFDILYHFEF